MPVRPELLVRDPAGIPIPPAGITARLQATIDPHLDLRYLSAEWAVIWRWPESDPRWQRVREQEISRDFAWDIVGYLPLTCSVDEAPAYLERTMRACGREDITKLCGKIADWNTVGHTAETVAEVIDATRDEMGKMDEITSAIYPVTIAPPSKRKPGRPRKVVVG